jgi:hypothetical protein
VNRAQGERDEFELYPCSLPQLLPRIRIPLGGSDADVVLELQAVLEQTYELGAYADRLDYRGSCHPPLAKADHAWGQQLIQKARKRPMRGGKRPGQQ